MSTFCTSQSLSSLPNSSVPFSSEANKEIIRIRSCDARFLNIIANYKAVIVEDTFRACQSNRIQMGRHPRQFHLLFGKHFHWYGHLDLSVYPSVVSRLDFEIPIWAYQNYYNQRGICKSLLQHKVASTFKFWSNEIDTKTLSNRSKNAYQLPSWYPTKVNASQRHMTY
ncbi:hypothetical protein GQX74_005927 [Glossina fuscipes]|nr:hypothetical protein GQX74_005927 [Glossina fuscipes]